MKRKRNFKEDGTLLESVRLKAKACIDNRGESPDMSSTTTLLRDRLYAIGKIPRIPLGNVVKRKNELLLFEKIESSVIRLKEIFGNTINQLNKLEVCWFAYTIYVMYLLMFCTLYLYCYYWL